jgi:hypothetical protein
MFVELATGHAPCAEKVSVFPQLPTRHFGFA